MDVFKRNHRGLISSVNDIEDKLFELDDNQSKFIDRFLIFKCRLLKKIVKENNLDKQYVVLISRLFIHNHLIYVAFSNNVLYYLNDHEQVLFKYRLINDRHVVETCVSPSLAFVPLKKLSYKGFFQNLLICIRGFMNEPNQFNLGTLEDLSLFDFDSKIKFGQFATFLKGIV